MLVAGETLTRSGKLETFTPSRQQLQIDTPKRIELHLSLFI
jgi:hypothetical protein